MLENIIMVAKQAGDVIAKFYHQQEQLVTQKKADASLLTEADMAAHHLIVAKLTELTPNIPIISEEIPLPDFSIRQQWSRYWSVDPLDGTHEFVHRTGEFVVSIALIENHYPVLGVLYAPLTQMAYFAAQTEGAFKQIGEKRERIAVNQRNKNAKPRIIISRRSHALAQLKPFLAQFKDYELIECSSALKFCCIAQGSADIYPRLGTTHEWDTAAGQCIVEAAGGKVVDLSSQRLSHNRNKTLKNPHFLAYGGGAEFLLPGDDKDAAV